MEMQEETPSTSSRTTQWDITHPGPTPAQCPHAMPPDKQAQSPRGQMPHGDPVTSTRRMSSAEMSSTFCSTCSTSLVSSSTSTLPRYATPSPLGQNRGQASGPRRPLPVPEICVCLQRALLQRKEIRQSISASASNVESVWAAQRHREGFSQREEPGAENAAQDPNNKASSG